MAFFGTKKIDKKYNNIENSQNENVIEISERNTPRYLFLDFESGITADNYILAKKIEAISELELLCKNEEEKSKIKTIKEKAAHIGRASLLVARNVSVVLMLALASHYELTHPDLEKKTDKDGNITYAHPDKETTHILNVLAGRDSLSYREGLQNFISFTKNSKEISGPDILVPENIDNFTTEEMELYWKGLCVKLGYTEKNSEYLQSFFYDYYFLNIEVPQNKSREIYDLVWQIEQECGNPNIRFMTAGPPGLSGSDMDRAYFDPRTNTMYIHMDNFIDSGEYGGYGEMMAEMSHSKHFSERPVDFYTGMVMSSARILYSGGTNPDKLSEAQQREYDTIGSLEHTAHEIIQPKLKDKYKDLLKLKASEDKK